MRALADLFRQRIGIEIVAIDYEAVAAPVPSGAIGPLIVSHDRIDIELGIIHLRQDASDIARAAIASVALEPA
jgi:hypothetical protein